MFSKIFHKYRILFAIRLIDFSNVGFILFSSKDASSSYCGAIASAESIRRLQTSSTTQINSLTSVTSQNFTQSTSATTLPWISTVIHGSNVQIQKLNKISSPIPRFISLMTPTELAILPCMKQKTVPTFANFFCDFPFPSHVCGFQIYCTITWWK